MDNYTGKLYRGVSVTSPASLESLLLVLERLARVGTMTIRAVSGGFFAKENPHPAMTVFKVTSLLSLMALTACLRHLRSELYP